MKLFLPLLFVLVFSLVFHNHAQAQDKTASEIVYLSGKDAGDPVMWDFQVSEGRKSGEWTKIPVPSHWEFHGFGQYNYGHDHSRNDRVIGKEVGHYRLEFEVPADWKDQVVRLVFGGSMTDTKVKVNGELAGPVHQGAFYEFSYEITDLLKSGQTNLLEVEVAKHSANESINRAERQADFWIFGGIFRPVFLEILPKTHFSRIAINPLANGDFSALLKTNREVKEGEVQVELVDQSDGQAMGSANMKFQGDSVWIKDHFPEVTAWNPEAPQLYEAKFTLLEKGEPIFTAKETIGFRTVELRESDGIYVNGTRVVFKGVNRHSSYPTTGRALSRANHLEDILLMKEMNMNAVRMSHYPPDEEFLDLCDSLGLFVLDEVTGWQDGYDREVGPKLIKETVLRDENHPAVILWDHGNEGGWDFANEPWFHQYDIQKRPVIYPWLKRNGADTFHYPVYGAGIHRLTHGQDIFFPTEVLHGLYDGGHGAGLEDFWKSYTDNPLGAGAFLWVFADEAIVRTDQDGRMDTDGNHAPDGIVGPYREKEGSFYTIKEIWSPIQLEPFNLNSEFDGRIRVSNRFLYTPLNECQLYWEIVRFKGWEKPEKIFSKELALPESFPGETRWVDLQLPEGWSAGDLLKLTAQGPEGDVLYTWGFPIRKPKETLAKVFPEEKKERAEAVEVEEFDQELRLKAGRYTFHFDLTNGSLQQVKVGNKDYSLSQNQPAEGVETDFNSTRWMKNEDGSVTVVSEYHPFPKLMSWTVYPGGQLKMEAQEPQYWANDIELMGLGFAYPEEKVRGIKWIGDGPYRVWQNRMKGVEFGLWEKEYNNTMTGHSFEQLIYPEFKGYHANLYAMKLETEEGEIEIRTETPGLFFSLYQPELPEDSTPGVRPPFPGSDLAFLYKIPAIGTKFHLAHEMGPQAQRGIGISQKGDQGYPVVLWFDFK